MQLEKQSSSPGWEEQQTCIQGGVLGQGNAGCLGKQTRHGDALGLEPLIQGIQSICVDAVCHSELRNLQCFGSSSMCCRV